MQQRQHTHNPMSGANPKQTLLWVSVIIVTLVMLPFLLAGDWFETAGDLLIAKNPGVYLLSLIIIAALTLDVLLPVPSSLVALGAGTLIGGVWGFAVLFTGFMAGAYFGYYLGRYPGRFALARMTSPRTCAQVERYMDASSPLALFICRPVPILAETTVVLAGMGGLSVLKFTGLMLLSNGLVAGFYIWFGGTIVG